MRRTYETPGRLALDLRLPGGSIEIETAETAQTELDLEPLDDASRELLETARVDLRELHDGHELVVETGDRRGGGLGALLGRGPTFRLRIRCPHGAGVDVRTKSADVFARGRLGSLEVKTASGDVHADEIEEDVHVQSASGDVEVRSAGGLADITTVSGDLLVSEAHGPLRLNAVSGDIVVRVAQDRVETNTVSGDQRLDAVVAGPVTLQSVSGDIHVAVRRGANVWLDVRSVSGDMTSALEPSVGPPDGGPVLELRAKSVSGDISISRASGDAGAPYE